MKNETSLFSCHRQCISSLLLFHEYIFQQFSVTKLEDVAGCLKYDGEPATLEDMEDAIRQGVEEIQF